MKRVSILLFGVLFSFLFVCTVYANKEEKSINDYYEVSIDLEKNKAIVDGEEIKASKLLNISDSRFNKEVSNNSIINRINNLSIEELEKDESIITIKNPYSTKSLIVETDKVITDDNIVSQKEIVDGISIVEYKTPKDTKEGYEQLKEDNINVIPDIKVKLQDTNVGWGGTVTNFDIYKDKLTFNGGTRTVRVAVMDSGINKNHEAFSGRLDLTKAKNYIDNSTDLTDEIGHGTGVAGIIAMNTPSNVKIVPIKTFSSNESGDLSNILEAASDLADYVDVVNVSAGISLSDISQNDVTTVEKILKGLYDKGVILVCASGNSGDSVYFPASSQYTLAAGALNSSLERAYFSCYGKELDFTMPGQSVRTVNYLTNNTYSYYSGTSFACPHLTTAIALLQSEEQIKGLSNIKTKLLQYTEDLGDPGKDNYYGNGIVNFNNKFQQIEILEGKITNHKVSVHAITKDVFYQYALTETKSTPTSWEYLYDGERILNGEICDSKYKTNYLWLKDELGNTKYIELTDPNLYKYTFTNYSGSTIDINNKQIKNNFTEYADVQKFKVISSKPCVILIDNKKVSQLNTSHEFSLPKKDSNITVVLKGDINLNGSVNSADSNLINRSCLSSSNKLYRKLSNIESLIADINENGTINSVDSNLLNRSCLSTTNKLYKALTW